MKRIWDSELPEPEVGEASRCSCREEQGPSRRPLYPAHGSANTNAIGKAQQAGKIPIPMEHSILVSRTKMSRVSCSGQIPLKRSGDVGVVGEERMGLCEGENAYASRMCGSESADCGRFDMSLTREHLARLLGARTRPLRQ